ncbi:MAG: hypothetical protein EB090_02385 [Verrucomicrobia bacterium]|nr:hypothetical protein [Verrucomicrobiota bacterium]
MAEGSTPMMRQYQRLRSQVPRDALLLFRLGDFYEMFMGDAEEGARLLNLTLTKRNGVPMCGLPFHAAEGYVTKLLAAGRRVALCDQVGEVKPGQMVERAVTRILSPGCAVGVELSEPKLPRWLAAVRRGDGKKIPWGFALLDASTGDLRLAEPPDENTCREELRRANPAEILLAEEEKGVEEWLEPGVALTRIPDWTMEEDTGRTLLCDHFRVQSLDGFGCRGLGAAVGAAGALVRYLTDSLKDAARHLQAPRPYRCEDSLRLDSATQRNLEILQPAVPGPDTSLIHAIDQTITAMGGRELRGWLTRPLRNRVDIERRHEAVGAFLEDAGLLDDFRETLREVRDLTRLTGRIVSGTGNAPESKGRSCRDSRRVGL